MKISWQYGKGTEIERLIYTASCIAQGTYQRIGFLLIEEQLKTKLSNVIFPFREISSEVWQELVRNPIHAKTSKIPPAVWEEFSEKFANILVLNEAEILKLKTEWANIEREAFSILRNIFDNLFVEKIIIIPSLYGTRGSFYFEGKTLYKIIRADYPLGSVICSIIQAQIKNDLNFTKNNKRGLDNFSWYREQDIMDYFMIFTKLSKFYPTFESLVEKVKTSEENLKIIHRSNAYYKKLGFPVGKCLEIDDKIILLNGEQLTILTKGQRKVLTLLLLNQGRLVSFEEIGTLLWPKNYYHKFSLNAITRMIYKLRQTLKDSGLQKEVIFTKRGQGYVLVQ